MASLVKHKPLAIQESDIRPLDENSLQKLLAWVDTIPLSRPKRNIIRDFSDGVLTAELIHHFLPKSVDLHNYSSACSTPAKETNWFHLNRRVLHKLNLELSPDVIHNIAVGKPWNIEHVLSILREKMDYHIARLHAQKHKLDEEFVDWMHTDHHKPEVEHIHSPRRKQEFQSLDEFYRTSGLKMYPDMYDLPIGKHQQIYPSNVSPRQRAPIASVRVDMVSRELLDEKERILQERQQAVTLLQDKVNRLEHFLHLKDIRMQDLAFRVQALEEQFIPALTPEPKTIPISRIPDKVVPPAGRPRRMVAPPGTGLRKH